MFESLFGWFPYENLDGLVTVLYYASFVLVPVGLGSILWDLWVQYRQAQFFAKQEYVLLEIKLPKEIFKSPKAMEFCIAGMYQTVGEKNWYEKYWKGQVRATFSLEIISIDGSVHFFIWARKGARNKIEADLYSQYPGIEIYQVPDYTLPFSFNPETTSVWASEFELNKPDAYPIKTYIDYGLEKDPKEEYKIDPITPLIEFLGGLPQGHQAWVQIIIRAHKAEDKDPETGKMVDLKWAKAAQKEMDDILKKAKGEVGEDGKIIPGTTRQLTEVEHDTVKALGRSVSKAGFDVGMRAVYSAPKDTYSPSNIGGIVGGITHFNSHLNGFKPTNGSEEKKKYLVWLSRSDKDRNTERQEMIDAYKRRAYFYKPFKREKIFVLNTEELATLFHFPGGVSSTPTFSRVESRKAEAPANLPI